MKYNDLRWSHFQALLTALGAGHSTPDAVAQAGITAAHWRRLRANWLGVAGHLAEVDPTGLKVDLWRIDALIAAQKTQGGRPKGAKDARQRAQRHSLQRPPPAYLVKDTSFCVEGGVFYIEDEG